MFNDEYYQKIFLSQRNVTPETKRPGTDGMIIDMNKYMTEKSGNQHNGRIDLENAKLQIQMYEKSTREYKSTEYRDALTGYWENNTLSNLFFSKENIQILQNGLRAGVYKMSQNTIVVAPQNEMHLKIIMRTIYLQHARHLKTDVSSQISILNKHVLDFCIPFVWKEAQFYEKYLEDQSTLVIPIERAKQVDRDFKQLQYKEFF